MHSQMNKARNRHRNSDREIGEYECHKRARKVATSLAIRRATTTLATMRVTIMLEIRVSFI
jgi:hypothetical protein